MTVLESLDPVGILVFVSVLLNYFEALEKIVQKYSLKLFINFDLFVGVLFEPVESTFFANVL